GLLGFAGVARGEEPLEAEVDPAIQARARELIAQLGDEHFSRREAATEALVHLGLSAVPALREASQPPDRQLRYRCGGVWSLAGRDKLAGELPLWIVLKNKLGDSAPIRSMYIEMLKSEWPLLEMVERDRSVASELISKRLDELQNATQQFQEQASLGSVSSML